MEIIQSITLGLVQGITEFLPISSSGHLLFIPKIFNWPDQGIWFDIVVHLGTLFAVILYFRKKLWSLTKAFCSFPNKKNNDQRLAYYIVASIIPVGLVGLFLGGENVRVPLIMGWSFIIWGVVLFFAERYADKQTTKKGIDKLTWQDVLIISLFQVLALIPGTSRSGITMTGGLFRKMEKKSAAEFSFLMSIPVIAAAGLLLILSVFGDPSIVFPALTPLVIGFIVSLVSALLAMKALIAAIERWGYTPFVVYRILIGVLILLFFV